MTKHIWLTLSMMVAVLAGCNRTDTNAAQVSAVSTPGDELMLNAPGCVATTGDGKPFSFPASAASSDLLIPKGTRFTAECFSTATAK